MKKFISIALAATMSATCLMGMLAACAPDDGPGTPPPVHTEHVDSDNDGKCDECGEEVKAPDDGKEDPPVGTPEEGKVTDDAIQTHRASLDFAFDGIYTDGSLADAANGFTSSADVTGGRFFVNGNYYDKLSSVGSRQDIKLELYNESAVRVANLSAGIAFTLPVTEMDVDYSIAKYRTQYTFGDTVLTASFNAGNPYTAGTNGWYTYVSEWLLKYFYEELLEENGIEYLREPDFEFTRGNPNGNLEIRPGYDVYRYDLFLTDNEEIERPYYHIAAIRKTNTIKDHVLFVMKSKEDQSAVMDTIVQSYERISSKGVARNYFDAGEMIENPNWNEATKKYYEKFISQDRVDWGAFSISMPGYRDEWLPTTNHYQYVLNLSIGYQRAIEEVWDYKFDIYPTYRAMTYAGEAVKFPVYMAEELAGGDGFNGKPVLQFTYQFTGNNNLMGSTPMFDIMRGKYDEQFRELARDVKNYKNPILFRLNNEMNSDWVSYCGLITLCDPDIYNITWRRLYNIFEEEGVDNAIWIWNPTAVSSPYCGWGEDLCYWPGSEYVQLLGGTYYELNNYSATEAPTKCWSFEKMYTWLYEKNSAFTKWAVILSEFGCGSGGNYTGELGRNRDVQLKWVQDMFAAFNAENKADYIKQIKGAIWFNGNDYYDEAAGIISNRYRIMGNKDHSGILGKEDYSDMVPLYEAFKAGLALNKQV